MRQTRGRTASAVCIVTRALPGFTISADNCRGPGGHRPGTVAARRLLELTPVPSAVAVSGNPVARQVISEQPVEIVGMARTALLRLNLLAAGVNIVLRGGVVGGDQQLLTEIRDGLGPVEKLAPALHDSMFDPTGDGAHQSES